MLFDIGYADDPSVDRGYSLLDGDAAWGGGNRLQGDNGPPDYNVDAFASGSPGFNTADYEAPDQVPLNLDIQNLLQGNVTESASSDGRDQNSGVGSSAELDGSLNLGSTVWSGLSPPSEGIADASSVTSALPAAGNPWPFHSAAHRPGLEGVDRLIRGVRSDPAFIRTEWEEPPRGIGDNGPPEVELLTLESVFPGWEGAISGSIIAVTDGILNISGPAEEFSRDNFGFQFNDLLSQNKKLNPSYRYDLLSPSGGLSSVARNSVIDDMLADRAALLYKRGNPEPFQVEALKFLQKNVNQTYSQVMSTRSDQTGRESRRDASVEMHRIVTGKYRQFFTRQGMDFDRDPNLRINARDYDTSKSPPTYRLPDMRIGDVAFDMSLTAKKPTDPQIRGFFGADAGIKAVIIVRPNQLGKDSTYMILRPQSARR